MAVSVQQLAGRSTEGTRYDGLRQADLSSTPEEPRPSTTDDRGSPRRQVSFSVPV